MLATDKQINCIEIIYNNVNFDDNCVKIEEQRVLRDKCISDYMKLYEKIKNKTLSKSEASRFIGKWMDLSKNIVVKVSGYGIGRNDGWDSDNYDVFSSDMYY